MVRFVLGPESNVVPDLANRLPGRGVWLTTSRDLVETACRKQLFSKGFKCQARVPADLPDHLEKHLVGRLVATISLARKAGQAVTGFEKTKAAIASGNCALVLQAADGAPDGRLRISRIAGQLRLIDLLTAEELGLAFGRDFAIHAALEPGGLAERAKFEARRLAGLRPGIEEKAAASHAAVYDVEEDRSSDDLAQDIG